MTKKEEKNTTYLIDRNGMKYGYNGQSAYCKKCGGEVDVGAIVPTKCPKCKANII